MSTHRKCPSCAEGWQHPSAERPGRLVCNICGTYDDASDDDLARRWYEVADELRQRGFGVTAEHVEQAAEAYQLRALAPNHDGAKP